MPTLVSVPAPSRAPLRRESIGSVLARNLTAARLVAGLTQHELAAASGVSRATIAQLETGVSDPRLSTVVELARVFGLPPLFLLVGAAEVAALARLPEDLEARPVPLPDADVARMRHLASSGLLKDRGRAARAGATVARAAGEPSTAVTVAAGIFSAYCPGAGTAAGISLGRLLT